MSLPGSRASRCADTRTRRRCRRGPRQRSCAARAVKYPSLARERDPHRDRFSRRGKHEEGVGTCNCWRCIMVLPGLPLSGSTGHDIPRLRSSEVTSVACPGGSRRLSMRYRAICVCYCDSKKLLVCDGLNADDVVVFGSVWCCGRQLATPCVTGPTTSG